MLKTALEAAALIGVVAAVIAGSLYAMGTVAWSSYFSALGFDAHQFPTAGLEPHVIALRIIWAPVICIIGAILIGTAAMKLVEPWVQKQQQKVREGLSTKWKKGWAVLSIAAAIGLALVALAGIHLWPADLDAMWWGAALSAAMLSAWLLVPRLLGPAGAALFLMVAFVFMMDVVVRGRAAYFAREDAEDWQKTKPNTIIEFTDGNKIPAPGTRVACSERFCGFHDGKTATVISSLEGVRSIQSPVPPPVPQEQPPHTSGK